MKNLKTSRKSPRRKGSFAAPALPGPVSRVTTLRSFLAGAAAVAVVAGMALAVSGCAGTHGQASKTDGVTGPAAVVSTSVSAVSPAAATPSTQPPAPGSSPAPAAEPASVAEKEMVAKGPQLWSDNCGRCHNSRSPSMYSDQQWEVVGMHMRVRANLTADDSRQILAFLKNAH